MSIESKAPNQPNLSELYLSDYCLNAPKTSIRPVVGNYIFRINDAKTMKRLNIISEDFIHEVARGIFTADETYAISRIIEDQKDYIEYVLQGERRRGGSFMLDGAQLAAGERDSDYL